MTPVDITGERSAFPCTVIAEFERSIVVLVAGRAVSLTRAHVRRAGGVVSMPEWLARDKGLL